MEVFLLSPSKKQSKSQKLWGLLLSIFLFCNYFRVSWYCSLFFLVLDLSPISSFRLCRGTHLPFQFLTSLFLLCSVPLDFWYKTPFKPECLVCCSNIFFFQSDFPNINYTLNYFLFLEQWITFQEAVGLGTAGYRARRLKPSARLSLIFCWHCCNRPKYGLVLESSAKGSTLKNPF